MRPDLVVRIPGGKHVVVDAKAPLTAYLDALRDVATRRERQARFADHARQVREHVRSSSAKSLLAPVRPVSPDFVVMFLPDEAYLRAAHEHDPSLAGVRVELERDPRVAEHADGALRSGRDDWQQETIAESAREVVQRSGASSTSG